MQDRVRSQLRSLGAVLGQATKSATHAAVEASRAVAAEVAGARCLQDYTITGQVATSGSTGLWRIYEARAKKTGTPFPKVSAWILDKSHLTHGEGASRDERALASFLEHCKREAKALARLRHPGILRVVAPIEELRSQLVFVTEAVECSLGGYLAAGLKDAAVSRMSELEVKHGLLQLAGAVAFLHGEAGLVHRGICPQAAFVAASGGWKLAGMGFAAPIGAAPSAGSAVFDYSGNAVSPLLLAIKPALAYTPPELVATTTVHVGSAGPSPLSDAFSFGLLAAELFSNRQVLAVSSSVAAYDAALRGMSPERDLRGVPGDLQALVEGLLALEPAQRCPVEAFASSPAFQNDRPLRALRFLEDLLQKSLAEKSAFFRDLSRLLPHMDARVQLRLVLPPVLSELETGTEPALLAELVPLVLRLSAAQSAQDRAASTLPALASLARRASGPALLALVEAAPELQRELAPADAARLVPGLLARALAADGGGGGGAPAGPDPRLAALQERAARVAAALAPEGLDGQALRATLVPAARRLCLATTSAPVRVACFELLAAAGPRLDARETRASLETAAQVAAVDRSAPTAAALGALGVAAARQQGPELAAELVLPTLSPLLVAPTLTRAQRAGILRAVRATLAVIEAGAIAEAGAATAGTRPESPGVASSARSQASRSSTPDPKPPSTASRMGAWAPTAPTAHTAPVVPSAPSAPTAHADTASRLFDPGLPKDAASLAKPLRGQSGNVGTWPGQSGVVPGQREGSTVSPSIKTPSSDVGMTTAFQGMGLGNGHRISETTAGRRNPGGPLDEDFWVQSQAPALSGPENFSQPTTAQFVPAQDPADPFGPLSTLVVQKPGSNGSAHTSAQGSLI